jgi:hypothetical protein
VSTNTSLLERFNTPTADPPFPSPVLHVFRPDDGPFSISHHRIAGTADWRDSKVLGTIFTLREQP